MKFKLIVLFVLFMNLLSAQVINEGFESGDFSSYPWELTGDADWFVDDDYPFEGDYCAEGGNIGDNQTTSIGITINTSVEGVLSFAWKVSSESGYDFFRFFLDSEQVAEIAGEVGWTQIGYQLLPGEHTLQWSYVKDYSVSNGSDTGWIDNVIFYTDEEEYNHDLEILSFDGPSQLQGGESYTYEVSLRNNGQFNFAGYTISLVDQFDNEYASETIFWMLAPGEENTVELEWQPDVAFPDSVLSFYGKGVASNDENPENDYSSKIDVHIIPGDYQFAAIGEEDNLTNQLPLNMVYQTSIYETMYFEDELPEEGMITSIDIFNDFITDINDISMTVWLGTTQMQSLTESWIPCDSLMMVYSGEVDFPEGRNLINLHLDTPFNYEDGNLVMMIHRDYDYIYHTFTSFFSYSILPGEEAGRTRYNFSDQFEFDPHDLEGGILCDWVANTVFTFAPLSSEDEHQLIKPDTLIKSIAPNPFTPGISRAPLNIEVNAESGIADIYDIKGRKVNRLPVNSNGVVSWDGYDRSGKPAASGAYLIRLQTDSEQAAARFMLVR